MSQPAKKASKKKKERAAKVFDHNYAKVTQVPELVELILSFLNQRTLRLTASLVCRLWRNAALPLLDQPAIITLDPANQHQQDPFNKDKFDQRAIDSIKGARVLIIKPPIADPYWGILGPSRLGPVHHQALMDRLNELARERELRVIDLQIRYNMYYQADVLPLLVITGHQLTSLCLKRMHFQEFFPLDEILLLCPRVLHVTVSNVVPSFYRLWPSDEPDHPAPASLPDRIPLRSLSLQAIGIETECLLRLLRATPALTDLELTKLIGGTTTTQPPTTSSSQASPQYAPLSSTSSYPPNSSALKKQDLISWSNMESIEKIASASLKITRLSISMNKPSKIKSVERVRILQKFPSLTHWASPSFDISSRTLETIRTTFADRVTSLEITGHLNQDIVGKALHQYLCRTPHLQDLRAPEIQVSVAWLDVEGILDRDARYRRRREDDNHSSFSVEDEQLHARVWMTGNLKTLHLGFGAGSYGSSSFASHVASRMVYGYISKTCPRLRDLSISSSGLLLSLEGGVSLLSRLQDLRRLVVYTNSSEDLKKDDLGWLALDLDPARNVEKKRLMERFITVEDRTIYSRTPFKSTLLSQDMPSKGRQKHLKPTIKPTVPNSRRYRERESSDSDTETDLDNDEEGFLRSKFIAKKKATKMTSPSSTASEDQDADYMMSGADMRALGHLQDIGTMFQKRATKRWQCWPELEYLEFQNSSHPQLDDNKTVEGWVQAIRPRLEFKCLARVFHRR
ncbi:hypothetical protein BGZ95_001479 [Linnemannia exigua]|uniref:F-box domain-containing protein n=1 Tax=Linnemannia exigua TaxID=604196 RepID=A0AAD4DL31_9FUNG|nr:hypothetical protein BGZ95_001479 [Linnemannia exigua]